MAMILGVLRGSEQGKSGMHYLKHLDKLLALADGVRQFSQIEAARHLNVALPCAVYVDVGDAPLTLIAHDELVVSVEAQLPRGAGWQWRTEQDEVGVYIVAKRAAFAPLALKPRFVVTLPNRATLMLNVNKNSVEFRNMTGILQVKRVE